MTECGSPTLSGSKCDRDFIGGRDDGEDGGEGVLLPVDDAELSSLLDMLLPMVGESLPES